MEVNSVLLFVSLTPFIFDQQLCAFIKWINHNLPEDHLPAYFFSRPHARLACLSDSSCPHKLLLETNLTICWGYEDNCQISGLLPFCPEDSKKWTGTKMEQKMLFWKTADFGFVSERAKELKVYCAPQNSGDSSLSCIDHLHYCVATNIVIDFSDAKLGLSSNPYREDILGKGNIGGKCTQNPYLLKHQLDHKSPLQSWAAEMEHFASFEAHSISSEKCSIQIDRPTIAIKLDATVNMYHHFCDFLNLYISQHFNGSFSSDINIIIWDTSNRPMSRMFAKTWSAFSDHPPLLLNHFDGKKVCFKHIIFSFLARMRSGLYYNMPLVPGCFGSSLVKAFSHHLIHRLRLSQRGPLLYKVRVTLLSRSTQYRQILNEEELLNALKTDPTFEVKRVDFNMSVPFLEQIEVSHNSDILVGIHGAGLAHMLFQPDWAVVIELYNCEDAICYYDLARLRGIKYMTWRKRAKLHQEDKGHHPTLGPHAKFTNYGFDVVEFMHLLQDAADHVKSHPAYHASKVDKLPPFIKSSYSTDNSGWAIPTRSSHIEL